MLRASQRRQSTPGNVRLCVDQPSTENNKENQKLAVNISKRCASVSVPDLLYRIRERDNRRVSFSSVPPDVMLYHPDNKVKDPKRRVSGTPARPNSKRKSFETNQNAVAAKRPRPILSVPQSVVPEAPTRNTDGIPGDEEFLSSCFEQPNAVESKDIDMSVPSDDDLIEFDLDDELVIPAPPKSRKNRRTSIAMSDVMSLSPEKDSQGTMDYTGALEDIMRSNNITAGNTQDYTAAFNDIMAEHNILEDSMEFTGTLPTPIVNLGDSTTMELTSILTSNVRPSSAHFNEDTMDFTRTIPSAFSTSSYSTHKDAETDTMDFTATIPSVVPTSSYKPHRDAETDTMDFTATIPSVIPTSSSLAPPDTEADTMDFTATIPSAIPTRSYSAPQHSEAITMEFTSTIPTIPHNYYRGEENMDATMDLTTTLPNIFSSFAAPRTSEKSPNVTMEFTAPILNNVHLQPQRVAFKTPEKGNSTPENGNTMEFTQPILHTSLRPAPTRDAFAAKFMEDGSCDDSMELTSTIAAGSAVQTEAPEEDCYDTMDFTGPIPTFSGGTLAEDENEQEYESTTDFTKALAGLFSTSTTNQLASDEMDFHLLDQVKLLNEFSLDRNEITVATPSRPHFRHFMPTQSSSVQFSKFLSLADLGSSYYNNYRSTVVPRGQDRFITPTKEDFFRAQCFLSQEVSSLQKDCEQLRNLVGFWNKSIQALEQELSDNSPAIFTKLSAAKSDNDRLVLQHKIKKVWEASLLEAKTEVEQWKLEVESKRNERLTSIDTTLQKDVAKSNRIARELQEMQEAIRIDREQMTQRHLRLNAAQEQGGATETTSLIESEKAQLEESKEEYHTLCEAVGWTPLRISPQHLSLRFDGIFDISLNLSEVGAVKGVELTTLPNLSPERAGFVSSFFTQPYLNSLFDTPNNDISSLSRGLSTLSIRHHRVKNLLEEVDHLCYNHPNVTVGTHPIESEPILNVFFSNTKSRQRFSVTFQLFTTYPGSFDSLGSSFKIVDFKKTIGTVTSEMVNNIFLLESKSLQTAQDCSRPLSRFCSCLEDLCLSLHY